MYIGGGRYQDEDRKLPDYDTVYSMLETTRHGPTLDFVAHVE
jgi:hypothetical protein